MADDYNPYQVPLESTLDEEAPKLLPSQIISERLEFEGELTRDHHRSAVWRTRYMSHGTWRGIRTIIIIAFLGSLPTAFALYNALDADTQIRLIIGGVAWWSAALLLVWRIIWIAGYFVPDNQLVNGHIRGWLDGERLCVETDHCTLYSEMDSLHSTASNNEIWVLNFSTELLLFQTIPFEFFRQSMTARMVADDLYQLYPPTVQSVDTRRLEAPTGTSAFEASSNAIHFEGALSRKALTGSRFLRHSKRMTQVTGIIQVCAFSICLIAAGVTLNFQRGAVLFLLIWIAFLAIRLLRRKWRRSDTQDVVWVSRGWVDEEACSSMTTIGETRMKWQAFDHFEITNRLIALYPNRSDMLAILLGREQFPDDQSWENACALVRLKLESVDVADQSGNVSSETASA